MHLNSRELNCHEAHALMKLMLAVGLKGSTTGDTLIAEKALEIVLERMVIRHAYSRNKYEQAMEKLT
ncbi:hypothetical protein HYE13_00930 [Mycoplasmopsis bovis]|nr:hypothetical protein [Mycoplasmopsis bovis]QQH25965.1 hypothetical protein HYE13_00930 [Mycoplasmopsis bovis]